MRGWSHGTSEQGFPGGSGAIGADGLRAPGRVRVPVGGDRLDRREDRMFPGDAPRCHEVPRSAASYGRLMPAASKTLWQLIHTVPARRPAATANAAWRRVLSRFWRRFYRPIRDIFSVLPDVEQHKRGGAAPRPPTVSHASEVRAPRALRACSAEDRSCWFLAQALALEPERANPLTTTCRGHSCAT